MLGSTWLLLLLTALDVGAAQVPSWLQGTWNATAMTTPLGPRFNAGPTIFLEVSSQSSTGEYFMRHAQDSQLFRISGNRAEYCFSYSNPDLYTTGADFAPFEIHPQNRANGEVFKLCWAGHPLPTHRANCSGCTCAQWTIRKVSEGMLVSTFMQSPPAIHLNATLVKSDRFASPPSPEYVSGGWNCELRKNYTGHPNQTKKTTSAYRHHNVHHASMHPLEKPLLSTAPVSQCFYLNPKFKLRLEYTVSKLPCMPCNVTYKITADLTSSEVHYLSIGFKEHYAAYYDWDQQPYAMPNYWGMATEATDIDSDLSGRIILGYQGMHGTKCVRRMKADAYVGSIVDVPDDGLVRDVEVSQDCRKNSLGTCETSISFTASIHAGKDAADFDYNSQSRFMANRLLWAIGKVDEPDDCASGLAYHFGDRAGASLNFPGYIYAPCDNTQEVMLETDVNIIV